jgi:hypothetical protein
MKNNGVFIEDEPGKVSIVLCDINSHIRKIAKEYKRYAMQSVKDFKDIVKLVRNDKKRFVVSQKIKMKPDKYHNDLHVLEFYFKDITDDINCKLYIQPYCNTDDNPDIDKDFSIILDLEKNGKTAVMLSPNKDFEKRYKDCKEYLLSTLRRHDGN